MLQSNKARARSRRLSKPGRMRLSATPKSPQKIKTRQKIKRRLLRQRALQGIVDRPMGSTIVARSPPTDVEARDGPFTPSQETQTNARVPLEELGGIFTVPVLVNSTIRLNFIIDSGSADVSIPSDVVLTLMRTGTLKDTDFIGRQSYKLADGSTVPSVTFRVRSLKVGGREI